MFWFFYWPTTFLFLAQFSSNVVHKPELNTDVSSVAESVGEDVCKLQPVVTLLVPLQEIGK